MSIQSFLEVRLKQNKQYRELCRLQKKLVKPLDFNCQLCDRSHRSQFSSFCLNSASLQLNPKRVYVNLWTQLEDGQVDCKLSKEGQFGFSKYTKEIQEGKIKQNNFPLLSQKDNYNLYTQKQLLQMQLGEIQASNHTFQQGQIIKPDSRYMETFYNDWMIKVNEGKKYVEQNELLQRQNRKERLIQQHKVLNNMSGKEALIEKKKLQDFSLNRYANKNNIGIYLQGEDAKQENTHFFENIVQHEVDLINLEKNTITRQAFKLQEYTVKRQEVQNKRQVIKIEKYNFKGQVAELQRLEIKVQGQPVLNERQQDQAFLRDGLKYSVKGQLHNKKDECQYKGQQIQIQRHTVRYQRHQGQQIDVEKYKNHIAQGEVVSKLAHKQFIVEKQAVKDQAVQHGGQHIKDEKNSVKKDQAVQIEGYFSKVENHLVKDQAVQHVEQQIVQKFAVKDKAVQHVEQQIVQKCAVKDQAVQHAGMQIKLELNYAVHGEKIIVKDQAIQIEEQKIKVVDQAIQFEGQQSIVGKYGIKEQVVQHEGQQRNVEKNKVKGQKVQLEKQQIIVQKNAINGQAFLLKEQVKGQAVQLKEQQTEVEIVKGQAVQLKEQQTKVEYNTVKGQAVQLKEQQNEVEIVEYNTVKGQAVQLKEQQNEVEIVEYNTVKGQAIQPKQQIVDQNIRQNLIGQLVRSQNKPKYELVCLEQFNFTAQQREKSCVEQSSLHKQNLYQSFGSAHYLDQNKQKLKNHFTNPAASTYKWPQIQCNDLVQQLKIQKVKQIPTVLNQAGKQQRAILPSDVMNSISYTPLLKSGSNQRTIIQKQQQDRHLIQNKVSQQNNGRRDYIYGQDYSFRGEFNQQLDTELDLQPDHKQSPTLILDNFQNKSFTQPNSNLQQLRVRTFLTPTQTSSVPLQRVIRRPIAKFLIKQPIEIAKPTEPQKGSIIQPIRTNLQFKRQPTIIKQPRFEQRNKLPIITPLTPSPIKNILVPSISSIRYPIQTPQPIRVVSSGLDKPSTFKQSMVQVKLNPSVHDHEQQCLHKSVQRLREINSRQVKPGQFPQYYYNQLTEELKPGSVEHQYRWEEQVYMPYSISSALQSQKDGSIVQTKIITFRVLRIENRARLDGSTVCPLLEQTSADQNPLLSKLAIIER